MTHIEINCEASFDVMTVEHSGDGGFYFMSTDAESGDYVTIRVSRADADRLVRFITDGDKEGEK